MTDGVRDGEGASRLASLNGDENEGPTQVSVLFMMIYTFFIYVHKRVCLCFVINLVS